MIEPEVREALESMITKGNFSEAGSILRDLPDSLFKFDKFSTIYERQGEYELAKSYAVQLLENARKQNNYYFQTSAHRHLAIIYWRSNKLSEAIAEVNEGFSVSLNLEGEEKLIMDGDLFYIRGILYNREGLLQKSRDAFLQSLYYKEQIGDIHKLSHVYNGLGVTYELLGDLGVSLEYHYKSLRYKRQIGNKQDISRSLINLGSIRYRQGRIQEAQVHYQEGLEIASEMGNLSDLAAFHGSLANVFKIRRKPEKAIKYMQKSLELNREVGNIFEIAKDMRNYIELLIDLEKDNDMIETYLEELAKINVEANDPVISHIFMMARAEYLASKSRAKHSVKAMNLYEELLSNPDLRHDFRIDCLTKLIDLLINELDHYGNKEIEEEVEGHLIVLTQLAKQERSTLLEIKSLRLKARLALIKLEFGKVRQLLNEAQILADERDLTYLAHAISIEYDNLLLDEFSMYTKKMDHKKEGEKMDLLDFEELLSSFFDLHKQRRGIIKEEDPVMVMILDEGGLPRYSHDFQRHRKDNPTLMAPQQLLGSFISALNTLGGELLGKGGLERVKYQDFTIIIKALRKLSICYIFKGQSFYALRKFNIFFEHISQDMLLIEHLHKSGLDINDQMRTQLNFLCDISFVDGT